MKRVINKKTYNTETAEKISSYSNGLPFSDFKSFFEELYRKKTTGEWFLWFTGGALSKYSVSDSQGSSGHSGIKPLTEEEAYQYLEDWQDVESIEKYFSHLISE